MNTLTLVPLGNKYINPEEIAAICPGFSSNESVITLRGNTCAVTINMSVDDVIDRLKSHFEGPLPQEPEVAAATSVLQILAPYFGKHAPQSVAEGVERVVALLKGEKEG